MSGRSSDGLKVVAGEGGQVEGSGPDEAAAESGDRLFATPRVFSTDFEFGPGTAAVFDDMISRSVPFYGEIQRMTGELARSFATPGSNLVDLGCATGTTLLALDSVVHADVRFIGIDNSDAMLAKARNKLSALEGGRRFDLVNGDLNAGPAIEDASVVIMLLTLQFVRPLYRERLVRRVYEGLRKQGCLIVVEKVTGRDTLLNRLFIEYYYDYKRRNGYSDLEIAQKREALENVLIPYHFDENCDLLKETGFTCVQEFFRWYNFCGLVAVK